MKKLVLVCILLAFAVPANAQSKLAIMKVAKYSTSHIYFCPGIGVKHDNLTVAQPSYWYGGQLTMELSETVEVVGRIRYDFANGNAAGAKPNSEVGLWYKIGL